MMNKMSVNFDIELHIVIPLILRVLQFLPLQMLPLLSFGIEVIVPNKMSFG